ncbi:hypothetical protein FG386_001171 [Cryptosporidium ryanae]|uniref:uncharacterized protein n=1 Tax=Cryptosporidium ryanae TaxID=515981 RepID=UPI00351A66E8|nr:hypothetical protein FG386_001171 [Cryptosporidium ryanae]
MKGSYRNTSTNSNRRNLRSNNLNTSSSRRFSLSGARNNGFSKSSVSRGFGGRRINNSYSNLGKRRNSLSRNENNNNSFSKNYRERRNNNLLKFNKNGSSLTRRRDNNNRYKGSGVSTNFRRRGSFNSKFRGSNNRRYQKNKNYKKMTVSSLDAALDTYMGSEVCKARLDSQLDSYFSGQSASEEVVASGSDLAMNMDGNQESVMI